MTQELESIAFHYYLGLAVSQWATIENELRYILLTQFTDELLNHEALSIGVFSLESFRGKIDFVSGVVNRKLAGTPHQTSWGELEKRTRRASTKRNRLAHWPVRVFPKRPAGRRIALIPWIIDKKRRKTRVPSPPPGSLMLRDVAEIKGDFEALTCALSNFRYSASGQPEPHAKHREQSVPPPTIANIERQLREAL